MSQTRIIYCCGCQSAIEARLTDGEEIYPHRQDLYKLPFWICDECSNYVGCHHKDKKSGIHPLGNIPTKELRKARNEIHKILDPLWKSGKYKRKSIYVGLTDRLGYQYHTANISSIEEARKVWRILKQEYY